MEPELVAEIGDGLIAKIYNINDITIVKIEGKVEPSGLGHMLYDVTNLVKEIPVGRTLVLAGRLPAWVYAGLAWMLEYFHLAIYDEKLGKAVAIPNGELIEVPREAVR